MSSRDGSPGPVEGLITTGPMPLAELARRARNAKTGAAVLQNAAHYLGEAGARLAAAYWLGRALEAGPPSDAVREQLAPILTRGGGFGGWVGLWRESAAAAGGGALAALCTPLAEMGPIDALVAALGASKDAFGDEGGLLVSSLKRAQKQGVLGFFDFLSAFRNRVYGHGTMLPEAVCRRLAMPFLAATSHVLRSPAVFEGAWLGRTAVDVLSEDGRHYWKRLQGGSEVALDDRRGLPAASEASPACLHFVRPRADDGADPSPPVSLSFLVVQEEDASGLSRFGFFQRAHGLRSARTPKSIEYLDYLSGGFRGEALLGELAALLPAVQREGASSDGASPRAEEGTGRSSERHFGDFVIESELGRGAMGIVYRAQQLSLGRSVALKVLPPALLEDPIALGRFHREVQALARCDHPNVVRVLASGVEEGRPWFAMELVEGADLAHVFDCLVRLKSSTPLTARDLLVASSSAPRARAASVQASSVPPEAEPDVERERPALPAVVAAAGDVHDRLALLFAAAADGVEEIHRRGLVHRDIKPANLLLTADGERLVVMDLGLAKPAGGGGSYTVASGSGFVGSARYAAPEQLQSKLLDVDHRADVYSLGATLWELATQTTLYPSDDVGALVARKLTSDPPPARQVERRVPRDLEIVLQKCLARRPEDRYPTAAELADDLRAFADRRPIRARPPSAFEYLRLFYQRQKSLVRAGAVVLFAALGLAVASFVLVARERAEAVAARDRAEQALGRADAERERAERLASFIADDLYQRLKPMGRLELLDAVSERIVDYYRSRDRSEPGVAARYADALTRLGKAREPRGKLEEAAALYGDAATALAPFAASDEPDVLSVHAKVLDALARVHAKQNRSTQALVEAEEGLGVRQRLAERAPRDDKAQHDVAASQKTRAVILEDGGHRAQALAAHRDAIAILERLAAGGDAAIDVQHDLAAGYAAVGDLLLAQGKRDEAMADYGRALEVASRLVARDPWNSTAQRFVAASHESRGLCFYGTGDVAGALAEYRAALAVREELGRLDPSNGAWQNDLSMTYHHLAEALRHEGQLAEAEALYQKDLEINERLAATDPSNAGWRHDLTVSINNLASLREVRGDLEGALGEYRRALALREELSAEDATNVEWRRELGVSCGNVARVLASLGRHDEALAAAERDVELATALAESDPANVGWQRDLAASHGGLAKVLLALNRLDDAIVALDRALALREKLAATDPSNTVAQRELAAAHEQIAKLLERRGRVDRAEAELRKALALLPPDEVAAVEGAANDTRRAELWSRLEALALVRRDIRRSRDNKTRSYNDIDFE